MVSWFHRFGGVNGFMVSYVSWCQWFHGFIGFMVSCRAYIVYVSQSIREATPRARY